jgi:hypothetical protein
LKPPFTRELSLVFQTDENSGLCFVDYVQPAMEEPLDRRDEVPLWLMIYPMHGLNMSMDSSSRLLTTDELNEILSFVYGELFPSAYSRDYEGGTSYGSSIGGFDTYVADVRERVQRSTQGKQVALVARNMLSLEARRLLAVYKRELDKLDLDV